METNTEKTKNEVKALGLQARAIRLEMDRLTEEAFGLKASTMMQAVIKAIFLLEDMKEERIDSER